jgi:cytochrome c-type biogenesis protein CcmH
MLWIIFAVLTGIAVFSVLWPLARAPRRQNDVARDIAFYEERLGEIDREVERALIGPEDAKVVKAEAARRLLATADQDKAASFRPSQSRVRLATGLALVLVPLVALGVYAITGHPGLPDQPLEARLEADPARMDLATAIAKVEAHLAQNPSDGHGYEVLAPAYLRLGRTEDAARAASTALRLLGETPQRLALYGETLVYAADGTVTKDAQEAFTKALASGTSVPKASLYLGLAAEQDGDKERALTIWRKLLAEAPPSAPWTESLRRKIAELSGEAVPPGPQAASAPQAESGPRSAQGAAIAAMPEGERDTVIRGMVDRLAQRLAQNGQDLDGWLRLVRAYKVLNEADKARTALSDARRNLGNDAAASARIDALARELGLEG